MLRFFIFIQVPEKAFCPETKLELDAAKQEQTPNHFSYR